MVKVRLRELLLRVAFRGYVATHDGLAVQDHL
jgi:hypothetical protein